MPDSTVAPELPAPIAEAIEHAEAQIRVLRGLATMQPGDSRETTVGALRPITHVLGLPPQPETLRASMPLKLCRTTEGWRVE